MSDNESQPSDEALPAEEGDELEEDELQPFRDSPVGTNDPNIVGDVGPFDTPPGQDPDNDL